VVHLIDEECSCFPTRKRVPYRIIIETIDKRELKLKSPDEKLFNAEKVEPDKERDLFNEVTEAVEKIFQMAYLNIPTDNKKLFAVDTEESRKVS
jgi:phosphatidylinositol 4-kinase B